VIHTPTVTIASVVNIRLAISGRLIFWLMRAAATIFNLLTYHIVISTSHICPKHHSIFSSFLYLFTIYIDESKILSIYNSLFHAYHSGCDTAKVNLAKQGRGTVQAWKKTKKIPLHAEFTYKEASIISTGTNTLTA
jgi:hypothetical protein